MLALTDKGKVKAEMVGVHGTGGRVLRYLANNGPSSMADIQQSMGPGVRPVVRALYQQGYIVKE